MEKTEDVRRIELREIRDKEITILMGNRNLDYAHRDSDPIRWLCKEVFDIALKLGIKEAESTMKEAILKRIATI